MCIRVGLAIDVLASQERQAGGDDDTDGTGKPALLIAITTSNSMRVKPVAFAIGALPRTGASPPEVISFPLSAESATRVS
jgi:hypothetical protein